MVLIKKGLYFFYCMFLRMRWKLSYGVSKMLASAFLKDYRAKKLPKSKIFAIHRRGFAVLDWSLMGVTEDNYKEYLCSVDYYKLHPINGAFTNWIDDKLTLKYICAGTKLDKYMPEYYFQIDVDGNILCLLDCPEKKESAHAEDVAALLRDKGTLAIKLIAGSIGAGFYKGEYKNDTYYLNGKEMNVRDFCQQISALRNYLVIEYLWPHKEIAAFCPNTVNSIRYLMGRMDGRMEMLKGFIRFGTQKSGFVENYNAGGVLCYLNANGQFEQGYIMSDSGLSNCVVQRHPDSGTILSGKIPMWDEIVEAAEAFARHFPQMKYLGMDFVVTSDDRVKVLEINSLTSLDSLQIDESILKTKAGGFYRVLLEN